MAKSVSDPKVHPEIAYGDDNLSKKEPMIRLLGQLRNKVWQDGMNRSDWESKMEHWYNVRYAFLEGDVVTPWPGSSKFIFPIDDQLIDRLKPGYLGLVSNQTPIVSFEELLGALPQNRDKARTCEYVMDYLLKVRDYSFTEEFSHVMDNVLNYGFGVFHTFYEYRTELQRLCLHRDQLPDPLGGFFVLPKGSNMTQAELLYQTSGGKIRPITRDVFDQMQNQIRDKVKEAWHLFDENVTDREAIDEIMRFLRSGEKYCETIVRQETSNTSRAVGIEPFDIWVPAYTRKMENASRVTVRIILTEEDMIRRVRDEGWNKEAAEKILKSGGTSPIAQQRSQWMINRNIDVIRSDREGIQNLNNEETYEVFITYCWGPFLNGKEKSRGIVVWNAASPIPLKACALPYNHGQWPFTQIRYELNDDRFYSSRGIPEKIADLSAELTYQERAVLNNAEIVNNPTFMYEEASNFDPNDIPWTPGQWIKVGRVDRIQPLAAVDRQLNFERHSQILRAFTEQYVGAPDLALGREGPSQTGATATEVNLVDQMSKVTLGFHSSAIQWGMRKVYKQYWSNWLQWGPKTFTAKVSGEDPIKLTKADIMGDFELIPKGTAGNINPALEAQKAMQRLSVLVQVKPMIDQDPQARYDADIVEAARQYFDKEDFVASRRLLRKRTPEEQQQIIKQRQQAAAQAQAQNGAQPMPLQTFQKQLDKGEKNAPQGALQPIKM